MKDETMMTIREMCEAFDVTPRTLRFYETKELLSPLRQGQKRLYSDRERARLKLILRGKRFGFDLEKIRQIVNLYEVGDAGKIQLSYTLEAGKKRYAEMTEQRDELNQALDELAKLIEWVASQVKQNQAEKQTAT